MDDNRYLISLLESAKNYVNRLQYLAINDKNTLRALNTLKLLNHLHSWAVSMGANQQTIETLQELMHCVIIGNSNLTLPEIIPGSEYSNVNTPQTEYTWQDIYDNIDEVLGQITIDKVIVGEMFPDNTEFILQITGMSEFNRTITVDNPVILNNLPLGTYTISEADSSTHELVSITNNPVVLTRLNPIQFVTVTNSQIVLPTTGTITINKIVMTDEVVIDDNTSFVIEITGPNGSDYYNISQDSPVILENLPFGTYEISEIELAGYEVTSISNSSITLSINNLNASSTIINSTCGEELQCNCFLSFSSYESNSISVLAVGDLLGGSCTLDEYVIDWYRDGEYELTSGIGSNPDITAYHPFLGISAIPVIAGNYTPIVRYIVINGQTIYSQATGCENWCNFNGDLPEIIVVNPIYCGLIGTGNNAPAANYDFKIQYSTQNDFGTAARSIKFDLSSTADTFAYSFNGQTVADRITIYYMENETPISDFIVGSDASPAQIENFPVRVPQPISNIVIDLPAYIEGSYLIIKITPSVISGNINTNWVLNMKCLNSSQAFNPNYITDSMRVYDINSINLIWNEASCRFELSIDFLQPIPLNTLSPYNYAYLSRTLSGSALVSGNKLTITHNYNLAVTVGLTTPLPSYSTPVNMINGSTLYPATFTKVGNLFTLTYSRESDYLDTKTSIDHLWNGTWKNNYVNDPTNINYYRDTYFYFYTTPIGEACGDNAILSSYRFHPSAIITYYPETFTITIQVSTITNGYVPPPGCQSVTSSLNSLVSQINSTTNLADFSRYSLCRYKYPMALGYFRSGISLPVLNTNVGVWLWTHSKFNLPFVFPNITTSSIITTDWRWYHSYFNFIITATRDSEGNWLQDPLQNFRLIEYTGYTRNMSTFTTIVYEKVNGVEIIKLNYNEVS